jgi:hypothetical protein
MIKLILFILKLFRKFINFLLALDNKSTTIKMLLKIIKFLKEDPIIGKILTICSILFKSFAIINAFMCTVIIIIFKGINLDYLKDYYIISSIISLFHLAVPAEYFKTIFNFIKRGIRSFSSKIVNKIDETEVLIEDKIEDTKAIKQSKDNITTSKEEPKLSRKDYKDMILNSTESFIKDHYKILLLLSTIGIASGIIYYKWDSISPVILAYITSLLSKKKDDDDNQSDTSTESESIILNDNRKNNSQSAMGSSNVVISVNAEAGPSSHKD